MKNQILKALNLDQSRYDKMRDYERFRFWRRTLILEYWQRMEYININQWLSMQVMEITKNYQKELMENQ